MIDRSWSDVTAEEIKKNKEKWCKHCEYAIGTIQGAEHWTLVCDYISIEGKSRGCSPIDCKKFKPRGERKRKRCYYGEC